MLLTLASIGKTFGLKGEFHAFSYTDFPKERFKKGVELFLVSPDEKNIKKVKVSSFKFSSTGLIIGLEDIKTPEEAALYRGYLLKIEEEKAPLPKGSYRLKDLIGCEVVDEKSNHLGEVSDVLTYGPTANFRVKRDAGKDFFVPFVYDKFVLKVDIENKVITIKVMEGLL